MSEYTLEIKQIVDYPRCRIYRQFVQTLIADRSIRVSGGSGLYYFVVLCAYANFRTSYKRIDCISYTIYPGEWIMSMDELSQHFRTRFRRQTLAALDELQKKDLISFLVLGHGKLVKFKIRGWRRHNTILDYNAPCQKDKVLSTILGHAQASTTLNLYAHALPDHKKDSMEKMRGHYKGYKEA